MHMFEKFWNFTTKAAPRLSRNQGCGWVSANRGSVCWGVYCTVLSSADSFKQRWKFIAVLGKFLFKYQLKKPDITFKHVTTLRHNWRPSSLAHNRSADLQRSMYQRSWLHWLNHAYGKSDWGQPPPSSYTKRTRWKQCWTQNYWPFRSWCLCADSGNGLYCTELSLPQ